MKKSLSRILLVLLCVVLLAGFPACTNNNPSSSDPGSGDSSQTDDPFVPANKVISVSWFVPWWMSESDYDYIFEEFERKYPGYTIEHNALDDLPTLLAAIQAGNQPDVWMGGDPNNTNFISGCFQSLFKNLDDYLTRDPIVNFNTLDKNQMELTKFSGGHYALPYLTTQFCMVYNKTLFERAGYSKPPETWSELEAYARKLTIADSNGKLTQLGIVNGPYQYELENGGNRSGSLKENGIDSNMDSDWILKVNQFCEKVYDIADKSTKPEDVDFQLTKGNAAINFEGNLNVLNDYVAAGIDIGLARYPRADEDSAQNIPSLLWNYFAIPNGAKNPDGGWLFAKFAMTDGIYQTVARDYQKNPSGLFPQYIAHKDTREKVYNTLLGEVPDKIKALIEERDKMVQGDDLYIIPYSPIHSTLKDIEQDWSSRKEAGEVNLKEKLLGVHNEYTETLSIWKKTMENQGWQFPEGAAAIPPEGYGK